MRILVMHSRYASGAASGENRVVDDEVRLLRERGHDVELWSPAPADGGRFAGPRLAASAIWSRRAVAALAELEGRHSPEVIHIHNLFPLVSPAVLRTARAPVVVTLHNYRLLCVRADFLRNGEVCERCLGSAPLPGVMHRCYRGSLGGSAALATSLTVHRAARTFDRVTAFLAVSEFVRSKHIAAGMDARRIQVKPNFVHPTARREGPGDGFVYVGRLSEEKGLHRLLPLWDGTGAGLTIVGDGPERARLESIAPPGVTFLGAVEPERVPALIRAARALVLPSVCYEGAPRTVVEAFAAGVPVIGSTLGGTAELVEHGATGMLAAPGDREGWHAAVARLSHDAETEVMGEMAYRRWQEHFSPARTAAQLEQSYRLATVSRTSASKSLVTGVVS